MNVRRPEPGSLRELAWAWAGSTAGRSGALGRERVRSTAAAWLSAWAARRARRSERVWRAIRLAGLPVQSVAAAPTAVLVELDPVGRVPLRLLRLIVPPLALRARERDAYSDSCCHLLIFLSSPARR